MSELLPCPFCGSSDIDPEGVASFKKEFRTQDMTWDKDATPERIEHRPACNQCSGTTDGDWNSRASGWLPIASAPRDSSRILVAYRNKNFEDWRVLEAWWRLPYEDAPPERCWWCYDKDSTLLDESIHGLGASHWQPLPLPPAKSSEV